MHEIGKQRFDAFAAYARSPLAGRLSKEAAWFETPDQSALAALFIDIDGDFAAVVMAPDLRERYRAIHLTRFHDNPRDALAELQAYLSTQLRDFQTQRQQGDESGAPIDFFSPVAAESTWHPSFRGLAAGDGFAAARDLITAMMRWHEDVDGNFIEQFQTTAFDARVWELYLFAALTEANLEVDRPSPAPDFVARGVHGEFAIEATTVNPRMEGGQPAKSLRPQAGEDDRWYRRHYLPIRYAGPLTTKLAKRYWESPPALGKPLVFAIQDFHDTMSMSYSGSALPTYLYGWRHEAHRDVGGRLIVKPVRVTEHVWGSKVVPSDFFALPDAEHISAVIFNSVGTLPKFNRMAVQAGFGRENVTLIHTGRVADPDPDAAEPRVFSEVVTVNSTEVWADGMDVFHNPRAVHPLDPRLLPDAAHHRLLADGQIETIAPLPKLIASTTVIIVARP